jgi:hypothetical protein
MGIGIAFAAIGLFTLLAVGFRWRLFVGNWRFRRVANTLGETGAVVFYVVLGLTCLVVGILVMTGIIGAV